MLPEEHKQAALDAWNQVLEPSPIEVAFFHARMGILEALLQMEVCGHGTRGFCNSCFWIKFRENQPVTTMPWR